MKQHSTYVLECSCGAIVSSEHKEMVCPDCGARIRVEWQAQHYSTVAANPTISDHYDDKGRLNHGNRA